MTAHYLSKLPAELLTRAARIRVAVFDVDGTLTDGRLWYGADGREAKQFHVHDGLGLMRLQAHGVRVAIITARQSEVVATRAHELAISLVYQAQSDKRACLLALLQTLQLETRQACYVGDDLPDLPAMNVAGLAIAVGNAHPWVAEHAHWQTRKAGGDGAAREVCDLLLRAQGKTATERDRWQ